MSLKAVKQTYEKLGRDDPLYAVLSEKKFQHNRWDPQAFFAHRRQGNRRGVPIRSECGRQAAISAARWISAAA